MIRFWKLEHNAGFYVFMFIYFYDFVIEPLLVPRPRPTGYGQH